MSFDKKKRSKRHKESFVCGICKCGNRIYLSDPDDMCRECLEWLNKQRQEWENE